MIKSPVRLELNTHGRSFFEPLIFFSKTVGWDDASAAGVVCASVHSLGSSVGMRGVQLYDPRFRCGPVHPRHSVAVAAG